MESIAVRLRDLRSRHRLTQQEFAELAGMGFKFYQRIESGKKKQIWLETVARLAAVYGLTVSRLLQENMPENTQLVGTAMESNVHYKVRKGPYQKRLKH